MKKASYMIKMYGQDHTTMHDDTHAIDRISSIAPGCYTIRPVYTQDMMDALYAVGSWPITARAVKALCKRDGITC